MSEHDHSRPTGIRMAWIIRVVNDSDHDREDCNQPKHRPKYDSEEDPVPEGFGLESA